MLPTSATRSRATGPGTASGGRTAEGPAALAVSPHHAATRAALDIMARGGSAVDGAIAANAVLGVVLPSTCGIGGDLFALVHCPGEAVPAVLNASGRSGAGASAEAVRAEGHTAMPLRGPHPVTVPGCVDGWEALVDRFGRLPLATSVEAAINAAGDGFEVSVELADDLARLQPLVAGQASAASLYPGGAAPGPGIRLRRPDLATTLEAIAAGGRDAFYQGDPGAAITAATRGTITAADLQRRQADWVEPLGQDLFGRTAWTVPPNSQGYLVLAGLWVFQQLAADTEPDSPGYHHALIEAYRSVAWERDRLLTDPDNLPLAAGEMISPQRLAERARAISPGVVAQWPPPSPAPGGTAYLCVVDSEGMGVSLIQSNFSDIGSGVAAGDTGVFLQNRGAGFSLEEGHPNELAPGRRPLHTLSPTLWTEDGRLDLLLGTRGGHQQPQLLMQVVAHLMHAGLEVADAQRVPRWTLADHNDGLGSEVLLERNAAPAIAPGLRTRGHLVDLVEPQPDWGPVSLVRVGRSGMRVGAADPRVTTAAAAGG